MLSNNFLEPPKAPPKKDAMVIEKQAYFILPLQAKDC